MFDDQLLTGRRGLCGLGASRIGTAVYGIPRIQVNQRLTGSQRSNTTGPYLNCSPNYLILGSFRRRTRAHRREVWVERRLTTWTRGNASAVTHTDRRGSSGQSPCEGRTGKVPNRANYNSNRLAMRVANTGTKPKLMPRIAYIASEGLSALGF